MLKWIKTKIVLRLCVDELARIGPRSTPQVADNIVLFNKGFDQNALGPFPQTFGLPSRWSS